MRPFFYGKSKFYYQIEMRIIIILISLACSKNLSAQIFKHPTPLEIFFQNNFDSTIIYHGFSSWYGAPNYFILSKKDNNIFYFTYSSRYRNAFGHKIPRGLDVKFMQEDSQFRWTIPDTNRYLEPVKILYSVRNKYWIDVNSYNIWKLNDNISQSQCNITDGSEDNYYLISKSGIKTLSFYEASECSRKNINHLNELKTKEIILKIFRENN